MIEVSMLAAALYALYRLVIAICEVTIFLLVLSAAICIGTR